MEEQFDINKQKTGEMGRILSNIFRNYNYYKGSGKIEHALKQDLEDSRYGQEYWGVITPSDLVEFMSKVGDEILSAKIDSDGNRKSIKN